MTRREFLAAGCATSVVALAGPVAALARRTQWTVRGSEGFDALSFLGPLSGDPFYLRYYEPAVAEFAPRLPAAVMEAIGRSSSVPPRPISCSPLSSTCALGGPDASIGDLIHSLDHAETICGRRRGQPLLSAGSEESGAVHRGGAVLRSILVAMRDAGFAQSARRYRAEAAVFSRACVPARWLRRRRGG